MRISHAFAWARVLIAEQRAARRQPRRQLNRQALASPNFVRSSGWMNGRLTFSFDLSNSRGLGQSIFTTTTVVSSFGGKLARCSATALMIRCTFSAASDADSRTTSINRGVVNSSLACSWPRRRPNKTHRRHRSRADTTIRREPDKRAERHAGNSTSVVDPSSSARDTAARSSRACVRPSYRTRGRA